MKRFLRDSDRQTRTKNRAHAQSTPQEVKRRVRSLKQLMSRRKQLEARFYTDVNKIENRSLHPAMEREVYERRRELVEGVPAFWLVAMLRCETLAAIVQPHDQPILW